MPGRRTPALALTLCATGLLCGTLRIAAADWPQWRGPARTAISAETGLLRQWPAGGPRLIWRIDNAGDGFSTPAVAAGRVFLVVNEGLANEYVRAFSAADGKVLWSTRLGKVGNPDQQPSYPAARSTASIDGDTVYALGSDGDLAALDAATGAARWKKQLRSDFGGVPGTWAYAESPLVDGDRVVVTPGGKTAMVALDKRTGAPIWRATVPSNEPAAYSTMSILQVGTSKQYVTFLDKGIVAVDAPTGAVLWRDGRTADGSAANAPTPVVGGNIVYHATAQTGGAAVRVSVDQGKVTVEQLYFDKRLPGMTGGTVLVNGTLYGSNMVSMIAADFATGAIKWQNRSIGAASVIAADGLLFLHGENGDVALVDASPAGYRERGRFTPPNQPARRPGTPGAGSKTWPHPVLADGRLYLRDLNTMWVYDVRGSNPGTR
jgi:outer membrane protein assembly factor BamB